MPFQVAQFGETEAVNQELRCTVSYKSDYEVAQRKYDSELNLSGKQVTNLPDLDCHLKKLVCTQSSLSELPSYLPSLLVVVNLDLNQISSLPDSIFSGCRNMKYLSLKCNRIQVMPSSLFTNSQLQILDVSNNLLVTLKNIWRLESLQKLYIQNNRLVSLPFKMREKLRNLVQIRLEWFLYLNVKSDYQVLNQPPDMLWSLFRPEQDLSFSDLNLRQEHLAHNIALNGHLHLLQEIKFDANRLNKRGESCLSIAMQGQHYDMAAYIVSLQPRVSLFLSIDHPIIKALVNKQFKLAGDILKLMNGAVIPNEDGYTLLHHYFANYQLCPEADQFFAQLVLLESSDSSFTNKLTCFEETALDLAIMSKTDALQLAYKNQSLFNFNQTNNSRGLSLIHRAVNANNFTAVVFLLNNQLCDPSLRNADGRLASDMCGQIPFLGKILRQATKHRVLRQIGSLHTKQGKPMMLSHFNLSVLGRRGRFYTKKRIATELNRPIQCSENAMSLAEMESDNYSNCDASISSHRSNVLSH